MSARVIFNKVSTLVAVLLFVIASLPLEAGQQDSRTGRRYASFNGARVVAGEILVKFKAGASIRSRNLVHSQIGSGNRLRKRFDHLNIEHLTVPEGMTLPEAIQLYQTFDAVEYAQPNFVYSINDLETNDTSPNDSAFSDQWALHNYGQEGGTTDADIDAPKAWDIQRTSPNVVVAVIDSGVDYNHVDLNDNIWTNQSEHGGTIGYDDDGNGYVDDIHGINTNRLDYSRPADNYAGPVMDDNGHGTHCAGIVGAEGNNSIGISGVTWDVQIMVLKFIGLDGSGSTADAIECIVYAGDNGADIISASWGGGSLFGLGDAALKTAIDDYGKLFVAAAGNWGEDNDGPPQDLDLTNGQYVYEVPEYPASFNSTNIIAVANTTRYDTLNNGSSYGAISVDLGAPGSVVLSTMIAIPSDPGITVQTINGAPYAELSGTSMATPHVAGAAALLLAYNPNLTVAELKQILMDSGDSLAALSGKCVSGKRLNLYNALLAAAPNSPPVNVSVSPLSGRAASQEFTITWSDANGASDLAVLDYLLYGEANEGQNLWVRINRLTNEVLMRNENYAGWTKGTLGSSDTISNTLADINLGNLSLTEDGDVLTLVLTIDFKPALTGRKRSYFMATDNAGAKNKMRWNGNYFVDAGTPVVNATPVNVSVSPLSGRDASQEFTVTWSDENGASDIAVMDFLLYGEADGGQNIWLRINRTSNEVLMRNENYVGWTVGALGSTATIGNTLADIDLGGLTLTEDGNTLTLQFTYVFKTVANGRKRCYFMAMDTSGAKNKMRWNGNFYVDVPL